MIAWKCATFQTTHLGRHRHVPNRARIRDKVGSRVAVGAPTCFSATMFAASPAYPTFSATRLTRRSDATFRAATPAPLAPTLDPTLPPVFAADLAAAFAPALTAPLVAARAPPVAAPRARESPLAAPRTAPADAELCERLD